MAGIVLTGHGNFATGILSAVELIAGKQDGIQAVDFSDGMSVKELDLELKQAATAVDGENGLVFFSDLVGGSPFKSSVLLAQSLDAEVIAGTNLPMILSVIFTAKSQSPLSLKEQALEEGKNGVLAFVMQARVEIEDEDGI
ncbi:PTS galactosamine/N-acetylgalactosamine transporter subunit IIA [Gottschalkiaceae bacterium SANA]|nr:PTS galactosamine/N-acetylgalactosamine transporter subunit IIA [Gottschalkiaceae bacterium SANA]